MSFESAPIFDQIKAGIAADPSLVEKTGAVYVYKLKKDGKENSWTIDLKNGKGGVYEGAPKDGAKADVTFNLADSDFSGLVTGKSKIGRAVQQECRDRSRMPSSA
eukprot:TRINITY_DN3560_c0_g1_i2.p1 TRINITY_DN3560_c0_g1~~TRINITY_DN3560_c0_g1_i2.p1  ORF type:complete len:105 (-),score=28.36 TRINITY_DN3560_c0_g1_i2:25-339(-)